MSRAQRLLNLLQQLRQRRYPVKGHDLAVSLGISLRTLYRDINTLREQGACIEGESGLGYVLKPGFLLPPMMFSSEEIEALVLGCRWVARRTDNTLAEAAVQALSKIETVLPDALKENITASSLLIGPDSSIAHNTVELADIRQAIQHEYKMDIMYQDALGKQSQRRIWPFALGYFEQIRILIAWCETRQAIRHFRTDRITAITLHEQHYPQPRLMLLRQWQAQEGISDFQ